MVSSFSKEICPSIKYACAQFLSKSIIDFARENHASVIVRGLRAITDFDYELQMAQTNRVLAPDVDTMFLTTSLEYSYLSSSTVKEVAAFGGDISKFLPAYVADKIHEKLNQ